MDTQQKRLSAYKFTNRRTLLDYSLNEILRLLRRMEEDEKRTQNRVPGTCS